MLLVLRLMRLLPLILLGISALLCQGSHLFLISSFLSFLLYMLGDLFYHA
uniref:Uncharacterized protein n=1 Tax=Picea sitchensis TaxID=3332 RepID=A0A6B9XQ54_PICSI|nr:hypothetical protein Q903MT_gene4177 [Picea sitchensis]